MNRISSSALCMVLVSVTGGAWAAAVVPLAELAKPGRVLMPRLLGAIAAN